jgi:acetolactate synthase-1/2/3 large subunit
MKSTAGRLVVRALEDEGARLLFGIPSRPLLGLHEALEGSKVRAVQAADERSAVFMADGACRASDCAGVASLGPGGASHALPGVAEARADNIPLVALCCGLRDDTERSFRTGELDQLAALSPAAKETLRPKGPEDVYAAVRRAFHIARAAPQGPVVVEISETLHSVSLCEAENPLWSVPFFESPLASDPELDEAAAILDASRRPRLYIGAGCRGAAPLVLELAETLGAPVVTTLQGKGVFPEDHPLWLWNCFGRSAPSFVRKVMDSGDCLLAMGCRFSETATGGYDIAPPKDLIHADADPETLARNFPARLSVACDAGAFLRPLLRRVKPRLGDVAVKEEIASGRAELRARLASEKGPRVHPAVFFSALQDAAGPDAAFAAEGGDTLFLAAEHLRLRSPRFLAPADFGAAGYAVPAAVGASLASPGRGAVALTTEGGLLSTGVELLTAARSGAGVAACLLRDEGPAALDAEAFARAVSAEFFRLDEDGHAREVLGAALERTAQGRPALVEVALDSSRRSFFSKAAAATRLCSLPLSERLRLAARTLSKRPGS